MAITTNADVKITLVFFLATLPKKDVIILKMSVENAAKLVISAGLVVPDYNEKIK